MISHHSYFHNRRDFIHFCCIMAICILICLFSKVCFYFMMAFSPVMQLFHFTLYFMSVVIMSLFISQCHFEWLWWCHQSLPYSAFRPITCPQPLLKCPVEFSCKHTKIKFTFNGNLCVSSKPNKPAGSISFRIKPLQSRFLKIF